MIVGNVFRQYDSRGIPLDIVFEVIFKKGGIPCWTSFYEDARKCGWKDKKILTTIENSLRDIGISPEGVIERLKLYIEHRTE